MSTRTVRLLLAGALLTAAAGPAVPSLAAAPARTAAAPGGAPETGVWWQAAVQDGTPQPTIEIPEGGLWLNSVPAPTQDPLPVSLPVAPPTTPELPAAVPTGDQAVGALRFPAVGADRVPEVLSLKVHEDMSTPALQLAVCATKGTWQPPTATPGTYDKRAVADCDAFSATGFPSADGTTVDFRLTGYPGGPVDLVLTRVGGDTMNYLNVTFEKPTVASLRYGSAVSSGGFVPPTSSSGSGFSSGGGGTGTGFSPGTSGGGFSPENGGFAPDIGAGGFDAGTSGPVDLGASADVPVEPGVDPASNEPTVADSGGAAQRAAQAAPAFESGSDAAKWAALVTFGLLATWIAAIVSRRLQGGGGPGGGFTLYRGTPSGP